MKFFRTALSIAILFAANSTFAARTVAAQTATEGSDAVVMPDSNAAVMPAARPAARGKAAAKKPAARKPAAKKPVARGKVAAKKGAPTMAQTATAQTYPQLVAFVKNSTNVWDNSQGLISSSFGQMLMEKALAAGLDSMQLDALLQTARDYHAKFSDNQKDNLSLLQRLKGQRDSAVEAFLSRPL